MKTNLESERSFATSEQFVHMSQAESTRQRRMRKAKKRSLQMSLFIVGGFLLCWMPYYSLYISLLFGLAPQEVGDKLMQNIFFFGMSNSLINPLIYGAFHLWRPAGGGGSSGVSTNTYPTSSNNLNVKLRGGVGGGHCEETSMLHSGVYGGSRILRSLRTPVSTPTTTGKSTGRPTTTSFSANNSSKPPPVVRCNTQNGDLVLQADVEPNNGNGNGNNGSSPLITRCATFDCTSQVDRKKVSLKRRQIKGQLYGHFASKDPSCHSLAPPVDYTQEILGDLASCSSLESTSNNHVKE